MPFAWFVALRYLRDARGQTLLILAAVSVGVSVIVFLSALINGLQASLIESTLGSQPHVTIRVPREEPRPLVEPGGSVAIARMIQPASQRLPVALEMGLLVGATLLATGVGLLAAVIPARQAAKLDPAAAIRHG